MQAIRVRYLGPTETQGARLKASCQGGSATIARDYDYEPYEQAEHAAWALVDKMGWVPREGLSIGALERRDWVVVFTSNRARRPNPFADVPFAPEGNADA